MIVVYAGLCDTADPISLIIWYASRDAAEPNILMM